MKKEKYNFFVIKTIVIMSIALMCSVILLTDATKLNPLYVFAGTFVLLIAFGILMPNGNERLRSTKVDS